MKKILVFLVMLLSAAGWGATYTRYVATTGDNSDGTTWAKAYTTLKKAIEEDTNGGGDTYNIYVMQGTYDESADYTRFNGNAAGNAKVECDNFYNVYPVNTGTTNAPPQSSDLSTTKTVTFDYGTNKFWYTEATGTTYDGGKLYMQYCILQVGNSNAAPLIALGVDFGLEFSNCSIIAGTAGQHLVTITDDTGSAQGCDIVFTNCVLEATRSALYVTGTDGDITITGGSIDTDSTYSNIYIIGAVNGNVVVDGCTLTTAEAAASNYGITFTTVTSAKSVQITGCTFTGGYGCVNIGDLDVPYILIQGNTMQVDTTSGAYTNLLAVGINANWNHTGTATGACAVDATLGILLNCFSQADDYWNGAVVKITSGAGSGQIRYISDYDNTGNAQGEKYAVVEAPWTTTPDATSVYEIQLSTSIKQVKIIGNVIAYTGGTTAGAHACLVGEGVDNAIIYGNYIRAVENGDYALVVKSKTATIENNIIVGTATGANGLYLVGCGEAVVNKNTIYSTGGACILYGTNTTSTDNSPCGNVTITNNILYATGSNGKCLSDISNDHSQIYSDYNCWYYTSSAIAATLHAANKSTLTDVLTLWTTPTGWGTTTLYWTDNDQHSVNYNPALDSNYQATNESLRGIGTPMLLKSDGTVQLRNDIGTTKFNLSGLRSRYKGGYR